MTINKFKVQKEMQAKLHLVFDRLLNSADNLNEEKLNQLKKDLEFTIHKVPNADMNQIKAELDHFTYNFEVQELDDDKIKFMVDALILKIELEVQQNENSRCQSALAVANKKLTVQSIENDRLSEAIVQLREKVESINLMKASFLSTINHEIRTPMNGILGFSQLLKEPRLTSRIQQQYIDLIKISGQRMLNILDDIISVSKIESGSLVANLKEVNINKQFQSIHDLFKLEADKKGLKIVTTMPLTDEDAILVLDGKKLYAVLRKLVQNALKYTKAGEVELGYKVIDKTATPVLKFFVRDTGIGIAKSQHHSVFERFAHENNPDIIGIQGAGLGLSISKSYVEFLKGKIWVESEVEKGATFCFTLPYLTKPKKNETLAKSPQLKANSITEGLNASLQINILIVDDDFISRQLLGEIVKNHKKMIFQARNGLEAVNTMKDNPKIDLILMDVQMPIMDGLEATIKIREFDKNVIIIAQTASALGKEKLLRMGCDDYLLKPINKEKLVALMQKYF